MAQETELKLLLRAQDLPRLLDHPQLAGAAPQRQHLRNTYFDTPELSLMQRRIAVRERRVGRRTLLTVKTAGESVGGLSRRGEWEGPTRPGRPDFMALVDDAHLARELSALTGRLVPLFRTDFVRRSWQMVHGAAHIELALDQGHIVAGPRSEPILELELELKQGPASALFDVALALGRDAQGQASLWLMPTDRSKAERGLALFRGQTVQPQSALTTHLTPSMDTATALRTAAADTLVQLQANLNGLMQPLPAGHLPDPEFVHQARVALRRLRAGLSLFREHLPPAFERHWSAQWKATAAVLGEARNWDVLDDRLLGWIGRRLQDGLPPDDLEPLADWVLEQRRAACRTIADHLAQPALAQQLLAFSAGLQRLPARDAGQPMAEWAEAALSQRQRRLLKQARRALELDLDALHALRIRLKKLRYAHGFLRGLLPSGTEDRLALLERAQDTLGELNDLVTALRLLQACSLEPARRWRQQLEKEQAQALQNLPRLQRALVGLSGR